MTKPTQLFLIASFLILVIGFIYYQGRKQGISLETTKQQQEQIEIKNDVIETKKFQQRIIRDHSVNDDSANRIKWLQLIWQKRDKAEK